MLKYGMTKSIANAIGDKSKHMESNDNGRIIIDFENNIRIMSTHLDHKIINKETWIAPDDKTRYLTKRKHTRSIYKRCQKLQRGRGRF